MLTSTGAYSCAQANFLLKRVASVKVKRSIYSLIFFNMSLMDKWMISGVDCDGAFSDVDYSCLACSLDEQVFQSLILIS